VIAAAAVLDLLCGDPPALPHPVSAVAWMVRRGERGARRFVHDELLGGALLTCAVAAIAEIAGATLERAPFAVRIIAAASTLACGSLLDHAARVRDALERRDIDGARAAVARIVGRDTAGLDEAGVVRAVIESLAESACDGIVAPVLYLCAFGLRGAWAYKAINTLDSLIGHIEPPYTRFGRVAARLDDCANYVPARVAAMAIACAALLTGDDARAAVRIALRDGRNHRSPNAGVSEAAMAGALGVRLGGASRYDGVHHIAEEIGVELPLPCVRDVRRAMRLTLYAACISYALAAALERIRR
jgi:adenosylcobinamide-phosphate synthase